MVGRRTKIVATIGPASDPPAVLRGILEAGANVAGVALAGAVDALDAGDRVALGDGGVALVVSGREGGDVRAVVQAGGVLRGRPGVSLPESRISLRTPTEQDLELLAGIAEADVDAV